MRTHLITKGSQFLAGGRPIHIHALGEALPDGRKCFKCSIGQPPTLMMPGESLAVVRGGCPEVPLSECGVEAPTSGTQAGTPAAAPVCPPGMDGLICSVKKSQILYKQVYDQQILAWGNSAQAQGIAADMAQSTVSEFDHPTLQKNWDTYAPWMGDLSISPEQWPALTKNFEQMLGIWNAVPWPSGELKDLFTRCAKGIPLYKDFTFYNPRFYVSDFFPKEDQEVRRVIALKSLENLQNIYGCMQHKLKKKARNVERQAKKWSVIGSVVGLVFYGNIMSPVFSAMIQDYQITSALEFSRFVMGYKEFVEECYAAEEEDFTCTYLAPFVLWAMETLFMSEFLDYVAIQNGLTGAEPGLTQEQVVKPIVEELKAGGVDVQEAAYTPGGVAPKTSPLAVAGGIGVVGVLAAVLYGAFRS